MHTKRPAPTSISLGRFFHNFVRFNYFVYYYFIIHFLIVFFLFSFPKARQNSNFKNKIVIFFHRMSWLCVEFYGFCGGDDMTSKHMELLLFDIDTTSKHACSFRPVESSFCSFVFFTPTIWFDIEMINNKRSHSSSLTSHTQIQIHTLLHHSVMTRRPALRISLSFCVLWLINLVGTHTHNGKRGRF